MKVTQKIVFLKVFKVFIQLSFFIAFFVLFKNFKQRCGFYLFTLISQFLLCLSLYFCVKKIFFLKNASNKYFLVFGRFWKNYAKYPKVVKWFSNKIKIESNLIGVKTVLEKQKD